MSGKLCAKIKAKYRRSGMRAPKGKGIHTKKFHDVVTAVGKKGEVDNPYAVAMSVLGSKKAVKKEHRKYKRSK